MTTSQLPRQLELTLNAISRAFRQALRFALKTDPQGTAETSAAWRAVADRQAMLQTMLAAAGPFLAATVTPPAPVPPQTIIPQATPTDTSEEITAEPPQLDASPSSPEEDEDGDEGEADDFVAALPPDLQELHRRITNIAARPTANGLEKKRKDYDMQQLQSVFRERYEAWMRHKT